MVPSLTTVPTPPLTVMPSDPDVICPDAVFVTDPPASRPSALKLGKLLACVMEPALIKTPGAPAILAKFEIVAALLLVMMPPLDRLAYRMIPLLVTVPLAPLISTPPLTPLVSLTMAPPALSNAPLL